MTLKKIEIEPYNYIPTGDIDHAAIQGTFDSIVKQMNENIEELNLQTARKASFVRVVLIEGKAPVELLEPRFNNVEMVSAFCVAADNIDSMDQNVKLVDNKGKEIVNSVTIKGGEKAGKAQAFKMTHLSVVSKIGNITVVPSSVRKVIVYAAFLEIK